MDGVLSTAVDPSTCEHDPKPTTGGDLYCSKCGVSWTVQGQSVVNDGSVLITFVLDRSGSMGVCRDATISGFNEFKNEQARQPGRTLFSLTQFDTEFEVLHSVTDISSVPDRSLENYVPRGSTALYDAVAYTIKAVEGKLSMMAAEERPTKHLFVIMTDGQENASQEFSRDRLFALVKEKEAEGWDFVYLGANQDAYVVGTSIGVRAGATSGYTSDPSGTIAAMGAVSLNTTAYRQGRVGGQAFFTDPAAAKPYVGKQPMRTPKTTPSKPKKKFEHKPLEQL